MDFEQYYDISEYIGKGEREFAKRVWNDCKIEVLKILRKHTIKYGGPHGTGREELSIDCIDEIRKL